jgi:glycerol-3-phosphate acyltransferase PlsY
MQAAHWFLDLPSNDDLSLAAPMIEEPLQLLWIVAAYLVGSIPFGFLAGKMRGIDIRQHGSGNIGATNVLRTLGKPVGITVLILDIAKGVVPVLLAQKYSDSSLIPILTAVATILGHNYTCFLSFKGGKGIATSAGVLAPLLPVPLLIALLLWILLFFTTRYVSIASISAAVSLPVTLGILFATQQSSDWPLFGFTLLLGVLAVWRHRSNIQNLRNGSENRFEPKKKSSQTQSQPTTPLPTKKND